MNLTEASIDHPIEAMIIGVEKAGTTSLLRYLGSHPDIVTHQAMEFPFFVNNSLYEKGYDAIYPEFFPLAQESRMLLAKNVGCIYWKDAPERMKDHNPSMKLIAVLREPASRAYSAYWYARQMGREDADTFEKAISMEPLRLQSGNDYEVRYHAYLARSLYFRQISETFKYFSPDQVQIVIFEEFKENPKQIVQQLFEFLGVVSANVDTAQRHNETSGKTGDFLKIMNNASPQIQRYVKRLLSSELRRKVKSFLSKQGPKKAIRIPRMDPATRDVLEEYFKSDIKDLEILLGRELDIWRTHKR